MEDGEAGGFKQMRKMRNAITHERFSADTSPRDHVLIGLETAVEPNECIGAIYMPSIDVDVCNVCEVQI